MQLPCPEHKFIYMQRHHAKLFLLLTWCINFICNILIPLNTLTLYTNFSRHILILFTTPLAAIAHVSVQIKSTREGAHVGLQLIGLDQVCFAGIIFQLFFPFSWLCFNISTIFSCIMIPKMILGPVYIHIWNFYKSKMLSLFWKCPLSLSVDYFIKMV